MGQSISHTAAGPPSPPAPPPGAVPTPADSVALLGTGEISEKKTSVVEKIDYLNLPCPIRYEEIQREIMVSLKPDLFEGLRFDFNKPLNQNFSLSHSLFMGNVEVPAASPAQILKIPSASYEFGANVISNKYMLIGRIITDGRMSARVNYQVSNNLMVKLNAQLTNEPHFSQGMLHLDYKGRDYQTQLQLGNNAFYGFNYIQSVTPTLSLGGEAFWLGHQRRSGVGVAARYNTEKAIATAQVASTGLVSLTYVQRVSDKVSLATEMMYNHGSREATTSIGYDYMLRQCRLRGRVDTNGAVGALLEERLNVGVNLLFSAEVDHWKKDYKFGFGMTVGE
eukprot:TRINITY_DN27662_c0_g1_i1.p1 TRINITY_DN27662_c0_g1~~TRINITY_DN27662_c0_g1_i1.p1  ORF type:complete len:337 (+),score=57.91 TRINITY_DN27662_c0_g1_i1:413-1423(+)